MRKQIEGVYERILECAKKEFLEKGYIDASNAGTSTNSIYVKFQDKEGLFGVIVEPEGELTKEFYHMMVASCFEGIFEVVRHRMSREDAKKYISMMGKYHHAGFQAIAGE